MHRWLGAATAVVVVLAAAGATRMFVRDRAAPGGPAGEAGAPRLQVDRERIDLGRVPFGQWVEAHFLLTNAGDGRLRLTAAPYVRAIAGC